MRLYRYRLRGIPKPIIIAADSREKARFIMAGLIARSETLQKSEILDETVERPISGVTTLKHGGEEFVWHADRNGTQGWRKRIGNG